MTGRLAQLRPRTPAVWALLGVLALGVVARIVAYAGTWPVILAEHDTAGYVRAARRGLVWSAQEPSGYPLFLRALHAVAHELALTTAVQHVLGLATGALLYAAVRRAGASRWVAIVPAAVVWLNGDQIFLERTPLSETVFTFLVAVALYAILRTREESEGYLWPGVAAVFIALLPTVRSVGDALVPLLALFLLLALVSRGAHWQRRVLATAGVGLLVLAGYAGVRHHSVGSWSIGAQGTGWNLYARAAPFADCHHFKPPAGTRVLCESVPADRRPGPGVYHWYPQSPAIRAFGEPPRKDRQLGEFALTAMVHQPLDYADAIFTDVIRYVDPGAGNPKFGDGSGGQSLSFSHANEVDLQAGIEARAYYGPIHRQTWAAGFLRGYQSVLRVHGWLVALLFALSVAGAIAARPGRRWPILLFGLAALDLLVFPAAVGGATWRYAIPADGLLAASAALGTAELVERAQAFERRRREGAQPVLGRPVS